MNGPKMGGAQGNATHHHGPHRPPPPPFKDGRPDHGATSSPVDRWQHASPLARAEEVPRKRYSDGTNSSYNRQSYSDHRQGGDKSHSDHHWFNNDRMHSGGGSNTGGSSGGGGGGGGGGVNSGFGGNYQNRDYLHGRQDHFSGGFRGDRPNHHRTEHYRPEYGHHYREQPHFAPRQPDEWAQAGHHPYGDRKRRSDEYSDWGERRPHKDPRLEHKDPRIGLEHKDPRMEHRDPRLDHKRHVVHHPPPGELVFPKP